MQNFIENQLAIWPLARKNYNELSETRRRLVNLGDFSIAIQYNPSRIVSTGAKVDKESISNRTCFLCAENRPDCQLTVPLALSLEEGNPLMCNSEPEWELLLNPYPIFPVHFTIASTSHKPQGRLPLEMAAFAENMRELAIFFNGARAGASAPDHAHMQAVLKEELPIVSLTERLHPFYRPGLECSSDWDADLPFIWYSAVVTPNQNGLDTLRKISGMTGEDADNDNKPDYRLLNAIMWIDSHGLLRAVIIPRRRHRPSCYGHDRSKGEFLVSPGTIDMAGIIIVPREEDFKALTEEDIRRIYSEVAICI